MLLRMKVSRLPMVLMLGCCAHLSAQLEDSNKETQAKCADYLKTPLPAEALKAQAPKTWPDCDSYKFYSGIGRKADYAAARRCAWAERLGQQADIEPTYTAASLFGGSAMLTVLYANGEGVEQNKSLALRFACESGLEASGQEDILALPNEPHVAENEKRFKYCDEVRTTMEIGICAAWNSEIQDQARLNSIRALSADWPTTQKSALLDLVKANEAYSKAHARGEIDLSGSGRAVWEFDAEWLLRERFVSALNAVEKGQLPRGTAADFASADTALNRTYKKAISIAEAGKSGYGAVQPEGVRDAERAWLIYRDAWIAFAKLRYPTRDPNAWLTLLTNDRIAVLEDTFCEMGSEDTRCNQREEDGETPGPLP
jgi:uncharacterized protein YecT (DUF1311 family)